MENSVFDITLNREQDALDGENCIIVEEGILRKRKVQACATDRTVKYCNENGYDSGFCKVPQQINAHL
jgi:hypothetical protein